MESFVTKTRKENKMKKGSEKWSRKTHRSLPDFISLFLSGENKETGKSLIPLKQKKK